MSLREDLGKAILNKLKKKENPLDGFFTSDETQEAILAVLVSGRHLLLEGPPGIGKTTVAKIIAKELQIPVVKVSPLAANWSENLINIATAIAGKK